MSTSTESPAMREGAFWLGAPLLLVFLALLLLEGVGFVFAWNSAAALAADLAPPERLGRVIGLFGAANLSMNAVAPWVGEELADRFGWDAPFLVSVAVCSIALLLAGALSERRAAPRSAGEPTPVAMPASLAVEQSDLSSRGRAIALVNGAFNPGSVATGFLLGAASDRFGHGPAFVSASIATLVGAGLTSIAPSPRGSAGGPVGKAAESAR